MYYLRSSTQDFVTQIILFSELDFLLTFVLKIKNIVDMIYAS